MADEKETILIDLKIDKGETEKSLDTVTKSVIELTSQTKELVEANKVLEKQGQQNSQAYIDNSKQIEINRSELSKNLSTRKSLIESLKIEDNSINAVVARNKELTKERNNLNLSTKAGSDRLKEINTELDKNNKFIKENVSQLEQQKIGIGAYKDAIGDAIAEAGPFGQMIDSQVVSFSKLANPITASAAALGGLVSLYTTSAAGSRDLESAQYKLGASFNYVGNELARMVGADGKGGGLLSSFATQVNTSLFGAGIAIQGEITASAQNTLKELEVTELTVNRVAKNALDQGEKLRRIRDDDTKSFADRKAAAEQVEGFINVREKVLVDLQNQKLTALTLLLAMDKDNLELQKQVKQVEFEIADIQEDSQGKRTEALNGINTLQKEQLDLTKKQRDEENKAANEKAERDLQTQISDANKSANDQARLDANVEATTKRILATDDLNAQLAKLFNTEKMLDGMDDEFIKSQKEQIENEERLAELTSERDRNNAILLNSLGQLSGAMRQASIAQKVFGSAQALVNTYLGATNVLTQKPPLPFPINIIALSATIATGLATVARINSVSFAQGGRADNGVRWGTVGGRSHAQGGTRYYGEDGHVVELERGEGWYVGRPNVHTKFLASMSQANVADGGRAWYAGASPNRTFALGGAAYVPQSAPDYNIMARVIANELSKLPAPIVTVEDINTGQSRVAEVQARARVL